MRKILITGWRYRLVVFTIVITLFIIFCWLVGWSGFENKKLWDWIVIFSPSFAALLIPTFLNPDLKNISKQAEHDRRIAIENHRAIALQEYLNKISDLLLKQNLLKSGKSDEVRIIAKALTMSVLVSLDPTRKGTVIQFIADAGLIRKSRPVINLERQYLNDIHLEEAQLRDVYLKDIRMDKANLNGIRLRNSDLSEARIINSTFFHAHIVDTVLTKADLSYSKMNGATLKRANLKEAKLKQVDFTGANLSGVDFADADLRGAIISKKQLRSVASLKGATMPNGSKHA